MSDYEEYARANLLLRYFKYEHLPAYLQEISKPFYDLAEALVNKHAHDRSEQLAAMRKLLEAKDAAVRCMLP